MSMIDQKLPSYQRQYQQKDVVLDICQQFNSINNFPFHLRDFHSSFIDPFKEIYLETFLSRKIVKSLIFTRNTNNNFQVFESKNSYLQSGLSSLPLKIYQSLIEIHPDFYDPICIQLERKFHKKEILNKILTIVVHSYSTFNVLSSVRVLFLVLIFELYIYAGT